MARVREEGVEPDENLEFAASREDLCRLSGALEKCEMCQGGEEREMLDEVGHVGTAVEGIEEVEMGNECEHGMKRLRIHALEQAFQVQV